MITTAKVRLFGFASIETLSGLSPLRTVVGWLVDVIALKRRNGVEGVTN